MTERSDDLWQPGPRMRALAQRAEQRLAPGGQNYVQFLPADIFPRYFDRAEGPYLFDPDGRRYLDTYCGSGAVILGHGHAATQSAVEQRLPSGPSVSFRSALEVELAEALCRRIPFVDRALFLKTGSEACNFAVAVALDRSKRRGLISIGYHGWLPPFEGGYPMQTEVDLLQSYEFEPAFAALEERPETIAAVIISPHPTAMDPEPYRKLERMTKQAGALFILDEVKTSFRAAYPCCATEFGLRPDLLILGKAIANGMPLSVVLANDALFSSSEVAMFSTFAMETFTFAAALATLNALEDGGFARYQRASGELYQRLQSDLPSGFARLVGVPSLFQVAISDWEVAKRYARRLAHAGVLFHPAGDVLLSASHDAPEIIDALAEAMRRAAS